MTYHFSQDASVVLTLQKEKSGEIHRKQVNFTTLAPQTGFEPAAYCLGDMFVELPAMSSHILLCISTMLRLLSISPVVQYSQLSEPFITKVIVSKKLAAIFQTAN